ncbi:hypothetical protein [Streptomyces sp. NPDC093260]|uniref:hypothetical protein n=1 Tax=Streptomyces sp. NPDC093260 TaxID=3155073 RepID=UPI0034171F76
MSRTAGWARVKGAKLLTLAGLASAAVAAGVALLTRSGALRSPSAAAAAGSRQDAARRQQDEEARRRRAAQRKADYFRKQRAEAARQARDGNHD